MLTTKFIRRLFSSSSSSSSRRRFRRWFRLDLRARIRRRAPSAGTKILVIRRRCQRCTANYRADLDRVLSSNNSTAPAPAAARQLGQEYHYEPNSVNKSKISTVINPTDETTDDQLQVIRVATFNVALFSMAPAVVRRVSNYSSSTSTASTFASAYNNNVGVGDHHDQEDLEEEEEDLQVKRAAAEGVQADHHEAGSTGGGGVGISSWRRSVELGHHRVGGGSDMDRNNYNRPKGILKVKQQQQQQQYRSSSVNFLKCSPAAGINGINLQAVKQQQNLVKKNNSKLIRRVSINLLENEISISRSRELVRSNSTALVSTTDELDQEESSGCLIMRRRSRGVIGSMDQAYNYINYDINDHNDIANNGWRRSMVDVLKEVKADVLALQEVRAEEEKGMKPLSELAEALGMRYVFAESWAPEYGNAVLSKWPIKRWQVQNIPNNSDYRSMFWKL